VIILSYVSKQNVRYDDDDDDDDDKRSFSGKRPYALQFIYIAS